jgi:hypothetical protein
MHRCCITYIYIHFYVIRLTKVAVDVAVEQGAARKGIFTIASGPLPNISPGVSAFPNGGWKVFLHASAYESDGDLMLAANARCIFLAQLLMLASGEVSVIIKMASEVNAISKVESFANMIKDVVIENALK